MGAGVEGGGEGGGGWWIWGGGRGDSSDLSNCNISTVPQGFEGRARCQTTTLAFRPCPLLSFL